MKFDVVTFGSAAHDVYIVSEDFKLEKGDKGVMLCEGYGSKVVVNKRVSTTGGGATNTAVCFERLGLQSAIVARVGCGHWGRLVKHKLKEEGVSLIYLQTDKKRQTSSSVILVGKDGGRTALVHRAASNKLSWHEVDWKKLNAKWAYVTSLGGDITFLQKIMRWANEKEIKVVVNPGGGEIREAEKLVKLAKKMEVLVLNKEELIKLFKSLKKRGNIKSSDILSLGTKMVIVSDGKNGAYLYHEDGRIWHQKRITVKTVEETGAGDSFGSSFVAGMIKELKIEESLKLAALNASSVVQRIGPKEGLMFWPEVEKVFRKK